MIGRWGQRTIDVDGLTLGVVDGDGTDWVFSKIDGWDDSPSVRYQDVAYEQSHGSFQIPGYRTGRSIAIDGTVIAANRQAAARANEKLAAVLGEGGFGTLTVTDADQGARSCTVQLAKGTTLDWSTNELVITYALELWAPDPIKYGPEQTVSIKADQGGSGGLKFDLFTDGTAGVGWLDFGGETSANMATITNTGTAVTWPRFAIAGPCDGFEIVESVTGSKLVYAQAIPARSTLYLDAGEATVFLDGTADRSAMLTARQWWPLPPNAQRAVVMYPVNGPDATLTVSYNNGWW